MPSNNSPGSTMQAVPQLWFATEVPEEYVVVRRFGWGRVRFSSPTERKSRDEKGG